MVCHLFSTKPLPEPIVTYYVNYPFEDNLMNLIKIPVMSIRKVIPQKTKLIKLLVI